MTEYGLFNDEGCVEAGFYSLDEAHEARDERYSEDELVVMQMCPEHEEQSYFACEDCLAEEEEEGD